MSKSSQAFRTIREVSDWLDVKAHVLRFWESKFPQIKPVKRAGGRRYYRPGDMELVGGIKVLLHDQGMTIKGVQSLIRDEGAGHVAALSPPIDILDFEDAPGDEIEAWDRELAADAVEEAEVISEALPQEGITEPDPVAAAPIGAEMAESEHSEPEPVAPAEPEAVPEDAPEDAAQPSDAMVDAADDDMADFDVEAELVQLDEARAGAGSVEVPQEPEFAFDPAAEPATDVSEAAELSPPPQEELDEAEHVTPEAAPPEEATPILAELATEEPGEDPAPVPAPEPAFAPASEPAADGPAPAGGDMAPAERPMIALMADFADLTARIPALSEADRAALAPLLARSADLAARLSR